MMYMKIQFLSMIKRNNNMFNKELNNLSREIRRNSVTRDLDVSLIVNQDKVEGKLNTCNSQLRVTQNEISENKAKFKSN